MFKKQIETEGSFHGEVSLAYMYGIRTPLSYRKGLDDKEKQQSQR